MGVTFGTENIIRTQITPVGTRVAANLGYADRNVLAGRISGLDVRITPNVVGALVDHGIIKTRFSGIESLSAVEPFMLKKTVTPGKIEDFNACLAGMGQRENRLETDGLFSKGVLPQGLTAVQEVFSRAGSVMQNRDGFADVGALGKGLGIALGAGLLASYVGVPFLTMSLPVSLLAATGGLFALTRLGARLPSDNPLHGASVWANNNLLPLAIAGAGLLTSVALFGANNNAANLLQQINLPESLGLALGLLWTINHFNRNQMAGLERSYPGHLDPSDKKKLKETMSYTSHAVALGAQYLAVRYMLFGAAAGSIAINAIGGGLPLAANLAATAILLAPALAFGLQLWGRNIPLVRSDFFRQYGTVLGLAGGAVASIVAGIALHSPVLPISYATFWGSLSAILAETHGIGHSINSGLGHINAMKSSSRDPIGETNIRQLAGKKDILVINPHTGLNEHTYGLLFSILLGRKPGLSFVCMYDRPIKHSSGDFTENFRQEQEFIGWVKGMQKEIQDKIGFGLAAGHALSGDLASRYEKLADNLESAADYLSGQVGRKIESKEREKGGDWFAKEVDEFRQASFQELQIRADEMRAAAGRLRAKARTGSISEDDFTRELDWQLGCYEAEIISVARKALLGDELKVRKVENISSLLAFRGQTVYSVYRDEGFICPTTEWVCGTWTRIKNPYFKRSAVAGTLEGSRWLWINGERLLTGSQMSRPLTTSGDVDRVDNDPGRDRAKFQTEARTITLKMPGEKGPDIELAAGEYYFADETAGQNALPKVSGIYKQGQEVTSSARDYSVAGLDQGGILDKVIGDQIFTVPLFEETLMMDKNDVELYSYLVEPALLEREKNNLYLDLIYRVTYSVKGAKEKKFDNPRPGAKPSAVAVVDANVELTCMDASGVKRIIPWQIDRSELARGVNEAVKWQQLAAVEMEIGKGGKPARISLFYGKDRTRVDLPESHWPKYLASLHLPEGTIGEAQGLTINNFTKKPRREGDRWWLKLTYAEKDGTEGFEFYRDDGPRPIIFNKSVDEKGESDYFKLDMSEDGRQLHLHDLQIPRGLPLSLNPIWGRGLHEGDRPVAADNTGNIYLVDGEFTPVRPETGDPRNYKGQVIGRVIAYDQEGREISLKGSQKTVALAGIPTVNRDQRIASTLEMRTVTIGEARKLRVIERRLSATGLQEDSSAHIYTLTPQAMDRIEKEIIDLSFIRKVEVKETDSGFKVLVRWSVDPDGGKSGILELPADAFADNDGLALLDNKKAGMSGLDDIYQTDVSLEAHNIAETERFLPTIDTRNGAIRLIVHKTDCYDIDLPGELSDLPASVAALAVFPVQAQSAVKIQAADGKERWLPLNGALKYVDHIDFGFSQVYEGIVKSVIGPQTRLGNVGEISGEYIRDVYFYGLTNFASAETLRRLGEYFGLNRAKALRAFRAIQSGRTHVMPYNLLFDPLFADMMETNNPNYFKLSNYGHHLWGPGVSEDTQMEMNTWLLGVRMHVVKEMVALMSAEKGWGNYRTQNESRYNYSEELFYLPFKLAVKDIWHGKVRNDRPDLTGWEQAFEVLAGRSWYKWPFAKSAETLAIPAYLVSWGNILFFPVDLTFFLASWSAYTTASVMSYTRQLRSLGFGFRHGLFHNPRMEWTFFAGYLKGELEQAIQEFQFATFSLTSGGGGNKVPAANKAWIRAGQCIIGAGVLAGVASLALGGIGQLANPGIFLNMFFGLYAFSILTGAKAYVNKMDGPAAKQRWFDAAGDEVYKAAVKVLQAKDASQADLKASREALEAMLAEYSDEIDGQNRVVLKNSNPFKGALNDVLFAQGLLEIRMLYQAREVMEEADDSETGSRQAAAQEITDILTETHAPVIRDEADKIARRFGLQPGGGK